MKIETERLILREFTLDDLDAFAWLMADPEVMRFSLTGPMTREQAGEYLSGRILDHYAKYGYGLWAVVQKEDNRVIGSIGLINQNLDGEHKTEVGYRLHPNFWGKGLATEACLAVCQYALITLGIKELISIIEPANTRSLEVAKRIGMKYIKDTSFYNFHVQIYQIDPMIAFLKKHENYSLFLLGNLENYGPRLTEAPFSGNYKVIRNGDEIIAVFCLTRKGNILIQSTVQEPIFDRVLAACKEENLPINGVVGQWEFCKPFWDYLKSKKVIEKETFTSKEILYTLNLHDFPSQDNVRLLTEDDYDQWKPLRLDYIEEKGLDNELTDKQLKDLFLEKAKKKIIWGYFLNDKLVSMADLNAKALDLGQVGGVYTAPEFRQRGYSRAVMLQLLHDAKKLHSIRKMIIFTGETNFPAQKLYRSLGVTQAGYFSLLFG